MIKILKTQTIIGSYVDYKEQMECLSQSLLDDGYRFISDRLNNRLERELKFEKIEVL